MNSKQKISCCKLGAFSSILAGFFYLIIAILMFQIPSSIITYQASETYFSDFSKYSLTFINIKVMVILASMAMIGVVCTFLSLCRPENIAIVLWSSILAFLGYSFCIYQAIMDISVIPELTKTFLVEPSVIQDVIVAFGVSNPKMFILTSGFCGIWFLVVSYLAISNKSIPKLLIILGFIWGIGNIFTAIGYAFSIIPILYLVSMVTIVVAPIWGLYEGFFLLSLIKNLTKESKKEDLIASADAANEF
ncbi:hypothetical protein CL647_03105 [bacterium]|nr:hypothetical protein [bacterium]|tara:strand:+ start:11730 stop:12473 length:744 start_codon:yes stop_codon:yes gene_type:complete